MTAFLFHYGFEFLIAGWREVGVLLLQFYGIFGKENGQNLKAIEGLVDDVLEVVTLSFVDWG